VARKKHRGAERLKELLTILKAEPAGDLRPKLHGFAYRFTLYLPLLSEEESRIHSRTARLSRRSGD
jgi:hypothetical protein